MRKSTTRRNLLTGAAVAAAGALAPGQVAAQTAGGRFQPARHSQDEWFDTIPGKHRSFIDTASPTAAGSALLFANNIFTANVRGYSLKESDVAVVICLRHLATAFAFNDAIWGKYGQALSAAVNFKDPKTGQAPSTNLFDAAGYTELPSAGVTISAVVKRGAHFAVCDMATNRLAGLVATATKGVQEAVYTEFVRNLIPNSHLTAAGVVAVNRAQEYGYTLLTAT
jgi:hypothetical protein